MHKYYRYDITGHACTKQFTNQSHSINSNDEIKVSLQSRSTCRGVIQNLQKKKLFIKKHNHYRIFFLRFSLLKGESHNLGDGV